MKAERYRITILSFLDASWSAHFAGLALTAEPSGVTRLSGEVADQAALHGVFNKIRDLNLTLVSVQRLDADGTTPIECRHCPLCKPAAGENKPTNTSFDH